MADDFDQTQALFLDEFEQDTDEDNQKNREPVAYLKVKCQKGFPEKKFPLYGGSNIIGRHEESCNVCIPLKALSREHACIEIKGESFLIFDKNSRNKTKRNKLYLTPEVRYELKNGDTLIFGDVESKFTIGNQISDDGSETGSESQYQTANDKEDITVEFDEEEYDSDNSIDLLQPTQAYHTHARKNTTAKSLIANDSLMEKETMVLVTETPGPSKQKITTGPVIDESGSETEDEEHTKRNIPQTLVLEEESQGTVDQGLMFAQTQACLGIGETQTTDDSEPEESILTGPTQAFTDVRQNEPTQTFVANSDTEEEDSKKNELQYASTQAYFGDESVIQDTQQPKDDMVVESEEEEDVSHLFTSSTLACDIDDLQDESDQQVVADETADFDQPTQAVLDDATQAVGDDGTTQAVVNEDATQAVVGEDSTQVLAVNDATQAVAEDATQAVVGEDATQVVAVNDATQAVAGEDATQAVAGEDATQAVAGEDGTQVVAGNDATQAVACDEDDGGATQVFPEEAVTIEDNPTQIVPTKNQANEVVFNDATVAVDIGETVAVSDDVTLTVIPDATVAVQEETVAVVDDAAVAVPIDATMVIDTTTVAVQDDATLAVQSDATVAAQDADTVSPVLDNFDGDYVPRKAKGRGRLKKLQEELDEIKNKSKGCKKACILSSEDQAQSSSQETDDGNVRRSGRAKRKSFRMVEMEESMDDMKGIDKAIRRGEDYSPESGNDSPNKDTKNKKAKKTKLDLQADSSDTNVQSSSTDTVQHRSDVPPLPKEVVEKTEAGFLMTLPALQDKNQQVTEATQPYTMDVDLPKPGMEEALQAYTIEVEDTTVPEEESVDEEGDVTPPIEDVLAATQPYSKEEEVIADSEEVDDKPALISIPSRSPLKPAIKSPEKRREKSPSPKRVQFAVKKTPSSSTTGSEGSDITESKSPTTDKIKEALVKKVNSRRKEEAKEDEADKQQRAIPRGRLRKKVEVPAKDVSGDTDKPIKGRGRKIATIKSGKEQEHDKEDKDVVKVDPETSVTQDRQLTVSEKVEKKSTRGSCSGEEKMEDIDTIKVTKGRKSHVTDTIKSDQLPTRGRRAVSTGKEQSLATRQTLDQANESVNLINTDDIETVKEEEKPSRKGRSRASTLAKPGTSASSIKESPQESDIGGDAESNIKTSENKTSISLTKTEGKVTISFDNRRSESADIKKTVGRRDRGANMTAEEDTKVELKTNSDTKTVTRQTRRGRSSDQSNSESNVEDQNEGESKTEPKQGGRRQSSGIPSRESGESEKDFKNAKTVGRKGKHIVKDETENKSNKAGTRRRGRSSGLVKQDNKDDESERFKPTGRRGLSAVVDDSSTVDDNKSVRRQGRLSKVGQNKTEESDSENSQDSDAGSVRGKGKGQRSSPQPPNRIESNPGTSRRGRMSVQPICDNKANEVMPPPKAVGKRGQKLADTQSDKSTSDSQRISRQSKQLQLTNSVKKEEKSFNLDDSGQRGRSSSRTKDYIETINNGDSKPRKRKRDSSEGSSDKLSNQSSTSKRAKNEKTDNMPDSSVNKKARSRASIVEEIYDSEDKDKYNNKSRTKKENNNEDSAAAKTGSRKRGRASDEESKESPIKKVKEDVSTPKRTSIVGVSSPSLRRKSLDPAKPKVIFTGVIDEHSQKVIKELGGEIASSVTECTHLVTDKIRRTVKFLCCLARGIPIVTLQWIESCKQSAMFVDCNKFPVKDSVTEKQYKFSLLRSLEKAKESSLLQGYKIHVTKSVKPEPSQMAEIISCAGGEYLTTMPRKGGNNTVIISCPEDDSVCKTAMKAGIPVVTSEFILTGILKQEVSINSYALHPDSLNTLTSGRRRR